MTDLVAGRESSGTPKRITFAERSTEVECGEVLLTLVVVLGLEGRWERIPLALLAINLEKEVIEEMKSHRWSFKDETSSSSFI